MMEEVHGPEWEIARRPTAARPRRPPRTYAAGGGRAGGPRGPPTRVDRPAKEVPAGAEDEGEAEARFIHLNYLTFIYCNTMGRL